MYVTITNVSSNKTYPDTIPRKYYFLNIEQMSTGAPNESGTPIRMPSVALLCIDSGDSIKYNTSGYAAPDSTPAQIQINKQAPLLFGYMTRISLTEINLAWATPNVNERNNTLTIQVADVSGVAASGNILGTYRIALTEGFRTPDNIATVVENALNHLTISGISGNFAVQHFPTAAEFVISSITPDIFISILPPNKSYNITATATNLGVGSVFTGVVEDDLTYMMGLTPASEAQGFFSVEVQSGYASCQYTPYVDIVSSILTKNQNVRDNDSALRNGQSKLARVYLSNPGAVNQFDIDEDGVINSCNIVGVRPFTLYREFQTPKVISWNTTENVDIVDLQVIDRLGYPIYIEQRVIEKTGDAVILGNTATFQFTLQATET